MKKTLSLTTLLMFMNFNLSAESTLIPMTIMTLQSSVEITGEAPFELTTDSSESSSQSSEQKEKDSPLYTKRLSFIEKNLKKLHDDIAKGEGEYLDTLATFYPLANSNLDLWKRNLQKSYSILFNKNSSPYPKIEAKTLDAYFTRIAYTSKPLNYLKEQKTNKREKK